MGKRGTAKRTRAPTEALKGKMKTTSFAAVLPESSFLFPLFGPKCVGGQNPHNTGQKRWGGTTWLRILCLKQIQYPHNFRTTGSPGLKKKRA